MTKIKFAAACMTAALLLGCRSGSEALPAESTASLPLRAEFSITKQFECLPQEAAFVAAHRGVSKGEGLAENSASSLKSLIDKGILFAEVDVAGLKDGMHILFHDGVWEEKSTGNGAVAASNWAAAEKILLNDTNGKLTADRPVTLDDALALSKDNLYLEIDFKSSAKYASVIEAIRRAGMADRVILIAYNESQAGKLAALAPEMAQSVTLKSNTDILAHEKVGVARRNMNAWLGRGPYEPKFMAALEKDGISVLAWPNREDVQSAAKPASLIVSDYAFGLGPFVGLSTAGRAAYQACLARP